MNWQPMPINFQAFSGLFYRMDYRKFLSPILIKKAAFPFIIKECRIMYVIIAIQPKELVTLKK